MEEVDVFDESFVKVNFIEKSLKRGTYEQCNFENCNFSNGELKKVNFVDCHFEVCDFSMCKIDKVIFNKVVFKNCKMVGFRFEHCNPMMFAIESKHSILDFSTFINVDLTKSSFSNCQLREVDFTGANLKELNLQECNLQRAIFFQSNLVKTDFRSAIEYRFNPNQNTVKGAKFNLPGVLGLLHDYQLQIDL